MSRFPVFLLLLCFGLILSSAAQSTLGPDAYPENINPLTGLPVERPEVLQRRPLIVKISNYPPLVRPQYGVNHADVVWEHLLAGGVTRFAAVFLSEDLERVGPIRSSRLIDFDLVRIYKGLFVYSGMAQGTLDRLNEDGLASSRAIGGSDPCPALCRFPREGVALEHTLFGDTAALRELAVTRERDITPEPLSGMAFAAEAPQGGTPIEGVRIAYRQTIVEWQYDAENARWLRFQDGEPHFDAVDDAQVNTSNLIIMEADHVELPVISDGYWGPQNYAFDVDLTGSGRVFFLRDGQFWEGEWRRDDRESPLVFVDAAGDPLLFKPGRTFINLVPRWLAGYWLTFYLETPLTATVTATGGVNLRLGPGTGFATPDVAYPGDTFPVIGRSLDNSWVQILMTDNTALWVSLEVVELQGDLESLPVPMSTGVR